MAPKASAPKKPKGKKTTKKVPKSEIIYDLNPPKPLAPTTDPKKLATRLAAEVNRVAYKKGQVSNGWLSYMEVAFFQLLKQGYMIIDPEGKAIDVVLPPEPVANRKPCAEVALLEYKGDFIVTPMAVKDEKLVKKWLKDRTVPHTAKVNKKTHYQIPGGYWESLNLHRDVRQNKGTDYWLLEGWKCKGK